MAVEIASAYVSISPSTVGFGRSLNRQVGGYGVSAGRLAGARFGSGFGRAAAVGIGRATVAIGAIGLALVGTTMKKGYDRLATIQSATAGLTVMLGDAGKAAEIVATTLALVKGTPFSLDQFTGAASQLIAFNVSAKKIPGVLTAIADAAAVMGGKPETVDRLTRSFGQMAAIGNVQLEDLWQITEAGVPALAILANAYNVPTKQMKKMITAGAVPSTKAIDILTKGIEKGSRGIAGTTKPLGGLAKNLGKTLPGAVANAGIAIARLGASILKPFSPQIVKLADQFSATLDRIGALDFGKMGKSLWGTILTIGKALAPLGKDIGKLFADLGPSLGDLVAQAMPTFLAITKDVHRLWLTIGPAVTTVIDGVVRLASSAMKAYRGDWAGAFAGMAKSPVAVGLAVLGVVLLIKRIVTTINAAKAAWIAFKALQAGGSVATGAGAAGAAGQAAGAAVPGAATAAGVGILSIAGPMTLFVGTLSAAAIGISLLIKPGGLFDELEKKSLEAAGGVKKLNPPMADLIPKFPVVTSLSQKSGDSFHGLGLQAHTAGSKVGGLNMNLHSVPESTRATVKVAVHDSALAALHSELSQLAGHTFTVPVKVARHAAGGYFTSAHAGIVAEAGPEYVINPRKPNARALVAAAASDVGMGGGSGVVYNIAATINNDLDVVKLAQRLEQLRRARARALGATT
jgi:tape measure domain-containing protein